MEVRCKIECKNFQTMHNTQKVRAVFLEYARTLENKQVSDFSRLCFDRLSMRIQAVFTFRLGDNLLQLLSRFQKLYQPIHVCLLVVVHTHMPTVWAEQERRAVDFLAHPLHVVWVHRVVRASNDERPRGNRF
jgi:hypothetical protein